MLLIAALTICFSAIPFTSAFSDPEFAVTCQGPLPDALFDFERPPGLPAHLLQLQHICASPDNGGVDGFTVGGYCDLPIDEELELSPSYHIDPSLEEPRGFEFHTPHDSIFGDKQRLAQFCSRRCTCTGVDAAKRRQPLVVYAHDPSPHHPRTPAPTYFINFTDPQDVLQQVHENDAEALTTRIYALSSRNIDYSSRQPPYTDHTFDDDDDDGYTMRVDAFEWLEYHAPRSFALDCPSDDPIPTHLRFPNDVDPARYPTPQTLCATVFDGGDPLGNAGAYCRPINDTHADVDFADEVTPKEWSWDYSHFAPQQQQQQDVAWERPPRAVQVRKYCWDRCKCPGKEILPGEERALTAVWDWLAGAPNVL